MQNFEVDPKTPELGFTVYKPATPFDTLNFNGDVYLPSPVFQAQEQQVGQFKTKFLNR